jgi:zinc D-Ala-D-Ala carboxypeptidase
MHTRPLAYGWIYLVASLLVIVGLIGVCVYSYIRCTELKTAHTLLQSKLAEATSTLASREATIATFSTDLESLKQAYAISEENGAELLNQLTEEQERNNDFEKQINKITGKVDKLDKLSKIDPELLMKYSKVYFLNEHYTPPNVAEINELFRFKKEEPEYIDSRVEDALYDLLTDAQEDGITLFVVSGYRSFNEQRELKSTYTTLYGLGANAFSADQGYSEHQLGTTVDFTTETIGGSLTGFESTKAYAWLQKHAHKYGFVLSYPKDNAYYIFEPWHWRFVGTNLAEDLHTSKKYFYDLDQREIDTYLISLFD